MRSAEHEREKSRKEMLLCLGAANLCIGLGNYGLDFTGFSSITWVIAALLLYGYARIQRKKEYLRDAAQKSEKD